MASRVTRSRDHYQVIRERNRFTSCNHTLNFRSRPCHIIAVNHTFGPEMFHPLLVIRNIVAMSEKHPPYSAHLSNAFCERASESRRVNQHVSFGPKNEIA